MAKYQHFEDLPVWQEAKRLYNVVLDLLEELHVPFSSGFRNQLDRAALSVSNNIAEGFERATTNELQAFIAIARGSSGEVRSMMALVQDRPRQLTGWSGSIEKLPFEGRRHLPEKERAARAAVQKSQDFRLNLLRNLNPTHPLYHSSEARIARRRIRGVRNRKWQMANGKHGVNANDQWQMAEDFAICNQPFAIANHVSP